MTSLRTHTLPTVETIESGEGTCKWHECSNKLDPNYSGPYPEFCSDDCWMDWMSEHPF